MQLPCSAVKARIYRIAAAFGVALLSGCASEPSITERNVARWEREADGGNTRALYYLGAAYYKGHRAEKDTQAAFDYWFTAASRGNIRAQHNLGVMYWSGDWVDRNLVLAYVWFNLAAGQGLRPSERMRDELEPFMTRLQIAAAQRMTEQISRAIERRESISFATRTTVLRNYQK